MLNGEKIRLRPVDRQDLPFMVAMMNDEDMRDHISRNAPMSMAEEEKWFDALYKGITDVVFIIEELVGGKGLPRPVGACGLHAIDMRNRNAKLGIMLQQEGDRGRGIGTDAMNTLSRHAFDNLGLHRVELEVYPANLRAQHVYLKVGYVVEGVRKQAAFKRGAFRDVVVMSLLEPDWRHRQPSHTPAKRKKT
jgi:RimJ/RimL family protein N-acetyltransferase